VQSEPLPISCFQTNAHSPFKALSKAGLANWDVVRILPLALPAIWYSLPEDWPALMEGRDPRLSGKLELLAKDSQNFEESLISSIELSKNHWLAASAFKLPAKLDRHTDAELLHRLFRTFLLDRLVWAHKPRPESGFPAGPSQAPHFQYVAPDPKLASLIRKVTNWRATVRCFLDSISETRRPVLKHAIRAEDPGVTQAPEHDAAAFTSLMKQLKYTLLVQHAFSGETNLCHASVALRALLVVCSPCHHILAFLTRHCRPLPTLKTTC
jgi:hypothetical protein